MIIDFHSHILPKIDDGSRSIEESLKILDIMANDGVDVVVATPHFYCHEQTLDDFIENRNKSYEILSKHTKENHPKILLGAEVLYSSKLLHLENLKKLCITGTNYLLLEMPYLRITNQMIDVVDELSSGYDLQLIIAHIERYLGFTSYDELSELMQLPVLGQLNARSFADRTKRKNCIKLMKDGYVQLLGTDYHRIDRDHEPLSTARNIINKKFKIGCKKIDDIGLGVLKNDDINELL